MPEQNLEETIQQLQASGVLFCVEYVGCVVVEKSINALSAERQREVARACMSFVLRKANTALSIPEDQLTDDAASTYVRGTVQPYRRDVEMNISSTAIILIDTNSMRPLFRFNIRDVSLLSPGYDQLSSFFCFFAKVQVPGQPQQWSRKCFVFNANTEMEDVRDTICYAFRLNEHNSSSAINSNGGDQQKKEAEEEDEDEEMAITPRPTNFPSAIAKREEMMATTPTPVLSPTTPPTPIGRELVATTPSSNNHPHPLTIPEIRTPPATGRDEKRPPEVPPRPRRYTSGESGAWKRDENGGGGLMPMAGPRQGRSGTMESGGSSNSGGTVGTGTRSNSISPRDTITVQLSPARYNELIRDLNTQNWFHGILPRFKADALIRQNGQFLVRQSPNITDQFVLVGMFDNKLKHVCLISSNGKIQTTIGEFRTIVDLISYFHRTRTPMLLHGEQLQLHSPISKNSSADANSSHVA